MKNSGKPNQATSDKAALAPFGEASLHSWIVHPLTVFVLVWLAVLALYMMHLSAILQFNNDEAIQATAYIVIPFVVTFFLGYQLKSKKADKSQQDELASLDQELARIDKKVIYWFRIWVCITIVEIIVCGGVPLFWLVAHIGKNYKDFGISSVHGLANALILSIGVTKVALYARTREKRHMWMALGVLLWAITIISRNMVIVMLLEGTIVWQMLRGISRRLIAGVLIAFFALILAFGFVGDMRTGGADVFRKLAQPTENYPDFLPSGFLWVYMYMTSPLNNLIYNGEMEKPLYSILLPSTTKQLFPTIIRNTVYGENNDALSEDLVTSTFNVSTAFVGPYKDFGWMGVAGYSVLNALLAVYFWRRRSLYHILGYAVIAQCLVISIFFNHLLYLPIIFQLFWLYQFCVLPRKMQRKRGKSTSVSAISPASLGS